MKSQICITKQIIVEKTPFFFSFFRNTFD